MKAEEEKEEEEEEEDCLFHYTLCCDSVVCHRHPGRYRQLYSWQAGRPSGL
jgi:hypothetical protein